MNPADKPLISVSSSRGLSAGSIPQKPDPRYNNNHWQPSASIIQLKQRAEILQKIRQFFADRQILEVETPTLSQAAVTDPHIHSFETTYRATNAKNSSAKTFYLQTSPEYAMKRLLAAGSGSIYQICKSFRNQGEYGQHHNPEFTMLEWYHVGFNHHDLMNEMDELLQFILRVPPAEKVSYQELFEKYIQLNPHTATINELKKAATLFNLADISGIDENDPNTYLYLFMSHVIEPQLPKNRATFVYDFPISQAALARIRNEKPPVAERFEVYVGSIELANGFHELSDEKEQRQRFIRDHEKRQALDYPLPPIDEHLLAALQHGLPDCSGVALGVDRLVMLATQVSSLKEVISFDWENA